MRVERARNSSHILPNLKSVVSVISFKQPVVRRRSRRSFRHVWKDVRRGQGSRRRDGHGHGNGRRRNGGHGGRRRAGRGRGWWRFRAQPRGGQGGVQGVRPRQERVRRGGGDRARAAEYGREGDGRRGGRDDPHGGLGRGRASELRRILQAHKLFSRDAATARGVAARDGERNGWVFDATAATGEPGTGHGVVPKDARPGQRRVEKSVQAVEEVNVKLGKQQTLLEKIAEGIKKQNDAFNLSKEIVGQITKNVSSISKSIAESIVLGKELNATLKQLAQQILVNIIAKTIERIALMGIEKALQIILNNNEANKDNLIRSQNSNLKKQIALQATLNAMGGGGFGGGGSLFSLFGFSKGGAVSKGQPVLVGERGAEVFVPNQTGQITQSARGTGGGPVNVNFAITTLDATGFQDMLVQNRGTISNIINQAVNERGGNNLV